MIMGETGEDETEERIEDETEEGGGHWAALEDPVHDVDCSVSGAFEPYVMRAVRVEIPNEADDALRDPHESKNSEQEGPRDRRERRAEVEQHQARPSGCDARRKQRVCLEVKHVVGQRPPSNAASLLRHDRP